MLPNISLSLLGANYDSVSYILQKLHLNIGLHMDFMDGTDSASFGLPSSWSINTNHYVTHHYMTNVIINSQACQSICIPYHKMHLLKDYPKHFRGIWVKEFIDIPHIYLNNIDYILLMCVEPGFCGQVFKKSSWETASKLQAKYNKIIQLDGGMNLLNIQYAQTLKYKVVTGSYGINNLETLNSLV